MQVHCDELRGRMRVDVTVIAGGRTSSSVPFTAE